MQVTSKIIHKMVYCPADSFKPIHPFLLLIYKYFQNIWKYSVKDRFNKFRGQCKINT